MHVALPDRRRHFFFGIAGMAALAALLIAAVAHLGATQPRLYGTSLGKADVAPDDTGGQAYSLGQFRGKVVVLTFLYTHCPDVCPLTADLLRRVDQIAGRHPDVVYLAVSVDPTGDSPESVAQFTNDHRLGELGDRWHYLVGDAAELSPIWQSYYIRDHDPAAEGSEVDHASAIYFIDKQGNRRVLDHVDTPPDAMARNERVLVGR